MFSRLSVNLLLYLILSLTNTDNAYTTNAFVIPYSTAPTRISTFTRTQVTLTKKGKEEPVTSNEQQPTSTGGRGGRSGGRGRGGRGRGRGRGRGSVIPSSTAPTSTRISTFTRSQVTTLTNKGKEEPVMSNEQQPTSTGGRGGSGRGGRSGGRGGRGRGRGRGSGRGRGRSSESTNRSNNNGNRNNYNSDSRDNRDNNNNNGYGKPDQNQQGQYQRKPRGQPPVPNTKKNGEKGADSHTVSESVRIKFTTILMQFREDDSKVKFEFPPDLSNTERKFLHELAGQLGVKSKSTGKGINRRIVITKPDEKTKKTSNGDEHLPLLKIGEAGEVALAQHMSKFPPSRTELMESIETGSSIVEAMSQHNKQLQHPQSNNSSNTTATNSAGGVLDALDRLGIGGGTSKNNEVSTKSRPVGKRVDLNRRHTRHAYFQKMKQQDRKK